MHVTTMQTLNLTGHELTKKIPPQVYMLWHWSWYNNNHDGQGHLTSCEWAGISTRSYKNLNTLLKTVSTKKPTWRSRSVRKCLEPPLSAPTQKNSTVRIVYLMYLTTVQIWTRSINLLRNTTSSFNSSTLL